MDLDQIHMGHFSILSIDHLPFDDTVKLSIRQTQQANEVQSYITLSMYANILGHSPNTMRIDDSCANEQVYSLSFQPNERTRL